MACFHSTADKVTLPLHPAQQQQQQQRELLWWLESTNGRITAAHKTKRFGVGQRISLFVGCACLKKCATLRMVVFWKARRARVPPNGLPPEQLFIKIQGRPVT